jgi:large subunit ribosomal protein L4
MLTIPVMNSQGQRVGEESVDPKLLGSVVRPQLLKQAVVAFLERQRQFSARTKGKSDTEGSTRKLYRQKGTGNARMGQVRTCVRRGGGRAFGKRVPSTPASFPKKMRRLARNNAVLTKIQSNNAVIVEDLRCTEPKTKTVARVLHALGVEQGCVLATHELDRNVYLSGRNIPKTDVRAVDELTAYEILRRRKMVFTRPAFDRFRAGLQG